MKIVLNKAKIQSILGLLLLALWVFFAVGNFKSHSWLWLAVTVALCALEIYTINRDWAWKPPKPKDPEDNNKTGELKKKWKNDL